MPSRGLWRAGGQLNLSSISTQPEPNTSGGGFLLSSTTPTAPSSGPLYSFQQTATSVGKLPVAAITQTPAPLLFKPFLVHSSEEHPSLTSSGTKPQGSTFLMTSSGQPTTKPQGSIFLLTSSGQPTTKPQGSIFLMTSSGQPTTKPQTSVFSSGQPTSKPQGSIFSLGSSGQPTTKPEGFTFSLSLSGQPGTKPPAAVSTHSLQPSSKPLPSSSPKPFSVTTASSTASSTATVPPFSSPFVFGATSQSSIFVS